MAVILPQSLGETGSSPVMALRASNQWAGSFAKRRPAAGLWPDPPSIFRQELSKGILLRPAVGRFAPQRCPGRFFPVILQQHLDPGKVLSAEKDQLFAKFGHRQPHRFAVPERLALLFSQL